MTIPVLEATERADPRGHAMHVIAAVAWAALQSVTNAGEGIAWGILVAVAAVRVPRIWRCYRLPVHDPVWLAFAAWTAWMCVGMLWAPRFEPGAGTAFSRWVLTPLALWPVMARPWLVLGAVWAGAMVQVAATLVLSWNGHGWNTYEGMESFSGFGQLQWQLHCAAVLSAVGVRWTAWPGHVAAALSLAAGILGVALTAGRTAGLSLLAGLWIASVRPSGPARFRRMRWAVVAAFVAGGAWLATMSPMAGRIQDSLGRADRLRELGLHQEAERAASSERLTLARAAVDIALEHPLRGGGHGWFQVALPSWALRQVARDPESAEAYASLLRGALGNAHNAFLHAWADGGIPGLGFLAAGTIGLAWRLWRQSRTSRLAGAALALYATIIVGIPLSIVTAKAPGAIIGLCLAATWSAASAAQGRVGQGDP